MFRVVTVTDQVQRRTPKQAKTSSVFKKIVMAVSGILMLLFLIAHMIGNLHVFQGAQSFNHYSEWLRTVGEPALPTRTLLTASRSAWSCRSWPTCGRRSRCGARPSAPGRSRT